MGDETSAEPISEHLPAAAPGPVAPSASVEVTIHYDSSTKPEDSSAIQLPPSEPPARQAEQPVPVRHKSLSFLQPGTQPGSLGRLGHFEVLELLGKGGFGIVLKALDDKLQRLVAIKVLGPQLTGSANARSRFVREARAAAAVNCKYVVSTYEVHEQPIPYLVMEYVVGKSLQDRLDRLEPFASRDILRIGAEIAQGLVSAHHQGLIHRDIKPANILLEPQQQTMGGSSQVMPLREQADSPEPPTVSLPPLGRVKIADFGLARAVDDVSLTQSGMIAGTPLFMSPEQARGETLDPRSDLFSLGSVLYTLCTSHPPFQAHTTLGVMRRVCDDTLRPIREINANIPEALVEIVNRLLVKDRAGRFQTAAEVAELLEQQLAHLDDSALPRPSCVLVGGESKDQVPAVSARLNVLGSSPKKVRRRRRLGRWLAAVCALLGFASLYLGMALWNKGQLDKDSEVDPKDARGDNPGIEQRNKGPQPDDPRLQVALARQHAARGTQHLAKKQPALAQAELEKAREIYTRLRAESPWTVLTPTEMKSQGGETLTVEKDGSIFVSGPNPNRAVHTLKYRIDLPTLTAIRLETIPDARLPHGGAGRYPGNGNFNLAEFTAAFVSGQADAKPIPIEFGSATADFSSGPQIGPAKSIDGNPRTWWETYPRVRESHGVVFVLKSPARIDGRSMSITLDSGISPWGMAGLGHFRLSVTNDADLARTLVCNDLKDSKVVDLCVALGIAHAQQGHINEAVASFTEALELAMDRAAKAKIITEAAPLEGVLEKLAERAAGNAQFQAELARHFVERGNAPLAQAARTKARTLVEEKLAKEPESSAWAAELADVLLDQQENESAARWTVLKPTEMKSKAGATLRLQSDGSILASGKNPDRDAYSLVAKTDLEQITAIRLEALPDPSLPHGGPGRFPANGNFHLHQLQVYSGGQPCPLTNIVVVHDEAQEFRNVLDGKIAAIRGWSNHPRAGKANTAIVATHLHRAPDDDLTFELHFSRAQWPQHNLGRFRLSVSGDPAIFVRERNRFAARNITDPWARLAAVWHILGDQQALDRLLKQHPGAAAGIGDLYTAAQDWQRAIAEYSKGLADQPADGALSAKLAGVHFNLGVALSRKGQLDQAMACYREAIKLDSKYARAHLLLGQALLRKRRYGEARGALARAVQLLPPNDLSRAIASLQVQTCERLVKIEARLPPLLNGEDKPKDNAERLDFAQLAYDHKHFAAAAGLWAEALQADPKLADGRQTQHRYNAACAAALAAAGQARDEPPLDDAAKAKLRRQALDWLKAELKTWDKLLESWPQNRPTVVQTLSHWQKDSDLAGIRDAAALAKLSADEQKAFARLWADVAALLKKAEENAK
jgi:serine/threonine protein kinase